jgi:hypothetical protein
MYYDCVNDELKVTREIPCNNIFQHELEFDWWDRGESRIISSNQFLGRGMNSRPNDDMVLFFIFFFIWWGGT